MYPNATFGKEITVRYWVGMTCIAFVVMMQWWPKSEDQWANDYDVYIVEAQNGNGLAVVTPDPFFAEAEWNVRIWRLDVHMRLGESTIHEELFIRAVAITPDTVSFVETAWGIELHVMEAHPDIGQDEFRRRRWVARSDGLEELHPSRGFGPFSRVSGQTHLEFLPDWHAPRAEIA